MGASAGRLTADDYARNFSDLHPPLTRHEAFVEADRCLGCKKPRCVPGCPVGIDIPGFIQKISQKDFRGAYDVITDTNLLPAVCGRVCPQESQCEAQCVIGRNKKVEMQPVAIGRLERFRDFTGQHHERP